MSDKTNDKAQITTDPEALKALAQVVMNQEQRIRLQMSMIQLLQSAANDHQELHCLHNKRFEMLEDELEGVKLREKRLSERLAGVVDDLRSVSER